MAPAAFRLGSFVGAALIIALAATLRGRLFATFATILLTIQVLVSTALYPYVRASNATLGDVYVVLQLAAFAHMASLVRARLRPLAFRLVVSWPGLAFVAGTFLAWPWAVAAGVGFTPHAMWLPYAAALVGLAQSLATREETIDVVLDRAPVASLQRLRTGLGVHAAHAAPHVSAPAERPLRVVQITDPHLGPFMPTKRLRAICARAVAREPDLILLTGDYVTMESHTSVDAMADAFAPLAAMRGRVFACFGNHDHEAPETVREALRRAGVTLLVDDAVEVSTPAGPVQIVGFDFRRRDREAHLARVCAEHPRVAGALRLMLLHDPGAFRHLPEGEGDLVFSGHTHGGQVGLVSLGLPHTIAGVVAKIPDHGLWARGRDRLYVHRGTGHYGFPLRVGVAAEESLVRIHVARAATA